MRRLKKKESRSERVQSEIAAMLIVVVVAFLGLSVVAVELTGQMGRFFSTLLHGLFGKIGSIAILSTVLIAAVLWLFKKHKVHRKANIFMLVVSVAVLLATELSIPAIRREFPFRAEENGGGLVGSFLGRLLVSMVGEAGALVTVVATLFLAVLWVTGTSFPALVHGLVAFWRRNRERWRQERQPMVRVTGEKPLLLPNIEPVSAPVDKEREILAPSKSHDLENELSTKAHVEQLRLPLTDYQLPDINLLNRPLRAGVVRGSREEKDNVRILEESLANFGVKAKVVEVTRGPTCTRYEMHLSPGTKVSKVTGLSNDLAMSLASDGVRIEAPIPGKAAIGIEVPNKSRGSVFLRDVVETAEFAGSASPLTVALGKDIEGNAIISDLIQMPHLLIAGATGAGKSVCINNIICSVLYKAKPHEVKMMLIDPKVVELSQYNGIPHLIAPVLNHPKKAAAALKWATAEMEKRYAQFARAGARDIAGFNERAMERNLEHMPYHLIVIDKLADLMMVARADVEDAICRLAQMARAAGMHLVIGTQRPSTDVITGLIKANIPSRLSFTVSSAIDSRVILDMSGAEKLLGQGDMLFLPVGQSKARRIQGAYVSNREIEKIVDYVSTQGEATYAPGLASLEEVDNSLPEGSADQDERFEDAVRVIVETGQASVSMLQRRMRLGYTRAARIVDQMEIAGIVGPSEGSRPRQINKNHLLVKTLLDQSKK